MRLVLLCGAVVLLSACVNHDNDYLSQGGQVSPIVVPAGVPAIKQEPYYPIPAHAPTGSVKPVSLKPSTLL